MNAERWTVLSPLLDELLELSPEQRAVRLAELDASLARDLRDLLVAHAQIQQQGFLDEPLPVTEALSQATLAGQKIGAYTLQTPIGTGGMSSVWLAARDDGRFEGRVAIKFLNIALLERGAERFAREGSLLARVSHPDIARLFDAGVTASGQPYLVLEYIDGEPIDAFCDRERLSIDARLDLFERVLGAVSHAHGRLVLHRDIKPANILVTASGEVKLLDFGVARLLGEQDCELTQVAGCAFTPEFAAPEQINQGEVSAATDVYSLGVLLYQLLTGAHRHPRRQRARLIGYELSSSRSRPRSQRQ